MLRWIAQILWLFLFPFLLFLPFLFLFLPLPLPLPRRCRCLFCKTRAPRCGSTFWGSSVGTVYILGVYTLGSVYTLGPRLFEAARSAARRLLYVYIHIYIYVCIDINRIFKWLYRVCLVSMLAFLVRPRQVGPSRPFVLWTGPWLSIAST